MTQITFNFQGVQEFVDPGPGVYDVVVQSVKQDASQSGKPRLHLILVIENSEDWEGGMLSYDIYLTENARSFAKQALVALGWDPSELKEAVVRLDTADLLDCRASAIIEAQVNPNTGQPVNRVTKLVPRVAQGKAPVAATKRARPTPASPAEEVDDAVEDIFAEENVPL